MSSSTGRPIDVEVPRMGVDASRPASGRSRLRRTANASSTSAQRRVSTLTWCAMTHTGAPSPSVTTHRSPADGQRLGLLLVLREQPRRRALARPRATSAASCGGDLRVLLGEGAHLVGRVGVAGRLPEPRPELLDRRSCAGAWRPACRPPARVPGAGARARAAIRGAARGSVTATGTIRSSDRPPRGGRPCQVPISDRRSPALATACPPQRLGSLDEGRRTQGDSAQRAARRTRARSHRQAHQGRPRGPHRDRRRRRLLVPRFGLLPKRARRSSPRTSSTARRTSCCASRSPRPPRSRR